MTLVRSKPSGYGFHDKLTNIQMELVDSQLPYALDGHAGGTYAPTDPITVGGDGMVLTGTLSCSGNIVDLNNCTFNIGGVTVCNVTVGSSIVMGTGTQLSIASGSLFSMAAGSTCTIAATTTVSGALTCSGATTVSGLLTTTGGVNINCAAYLMAGKTMTIDATANIAQGGTITNTAKGHRIDRFYSMTNVDQTIGVSSGTVATDGADLVYIPATTGHRDITITSTGAVVGCRMVFMTAEGTNTTTLRQDDNTVIVILQNVAASYKKVELVHNGSANGWLLWDAWQL